MFNINCVLKSSIQKRKRKYSKIKLSDTHWHCSVLIVSRNSICQSANWLKMHDISFVWFILPVCMQPVFVNLGMENKTRDKSYKIIISKANISWRPLGRVLALPRDVSPSITCLRPILLQTNITQSHPPATKLGSLFPFFGGTILCV